MLLSGQPSQSALRLKDYQVETYHLFQYRNLLKPDELVLSRINAPCRFHLLDCRSMNSSSRASRSCSSRVSPVAHRHKQMQEESCLGTRNKASRDRMSNERSITAVSPLASPMTPVAVSLVALFTHSAERQEPQGRIGKFGTH